jgi:uncharacterized protein
MTDKTDILLELGEVTDQEEWRDYARLGFSEADVGALLAIIGDESLHQADDASREIWAPLHAWRALGQIGSANAVEPLLARFDQLCHDDWALPELSRVLGMIGAPAVPALARYLNEYQHDEFARVMAMDALFEVARHNPEQRNEVIGILCEYIHKPDKNTRVLNGLTVGRLIDLDAREAIDDLRALFAMHCIDITCNGDLEAVEIELGVRDERSTPKPNYVELDQQELQRYFDENGIDHSPATNDVPDDDNIYHIIDYFLERYGSDESVLDASELDGFFASLACAPNSVLPSQWLPAIWGSEGNMPVWEDQDDIQAFSQAAFALYNAVMEAMNAGDYEALFLFREIDGTTCTIVDEWCHGFLRGMALWEPLPPADAAFTEERLENVHLFATETGFEQRDKMTDEEIETHQQQIDRDVQRLFEYFLEKRHAALAPVVRDTPKVGRNDPCPCGSGKKYKKCCLH